MLKLDFEKAFDHVDSEFWDFLDRVMMKKDFGNKWRMWMWGCVRNVYYILISGVPKGAIQASRGLRHGDLVSVFVLTGCGSRLISKGVDGNIIELFKIGRDEVALSHLQFADDMVEFFPHPQSYSRIL